METVVAISAMGVGISAGIVAFVVSTPALIGLVIGTILTGIIAFAMARA